MLLVPCGMSSALYTLLLQQRLQHRHKYAEYTIGNHLIMTYIKILCGYIAAHGPLWPLVALV